jgi:hypothetical protein
MIFIGGSPEAAVFLIRLSSALALLSASVCSATSGEEVDAEATDWAAEAPLLEPTGNTGT